MAGFLYDHHGESVVGCCTGALLFVQLVYCA